MRRWKSPWVIYVFAGVSIAIFSGLSIGMLSLQQKIVVATNETCDLLVPRFLEQIRAVRNLEMLVQYGNLAAKAKDPADRQDAAFLAAYAAANPSNMTDEKTKILAREAYKEIQVISIRERNPAEWKPTQERLISRADELAVDAGGLVTRCATSVRYDAVKVRDTAIVLTTLFTIGIAIMIILGRILYMRIQAKGMLFNEASHDLRQRLHGMQLLLNAAQRVAVEERSHVMSKVKSATTDLQRYLNNFLEIARLDSVMEKPNFEKITLHKIFQRLEFQFEEMAVHFGVDIKFRSTNLTCTSDERIISKLLENLVANAIKFSKSRVLVGARQRNSKIEIWVLDNGMGMPSILRNGSYAEFVQGENAPKQEAFDRGFGLGLSIVVRSAGLLGAQLKVNSNPGHGLAVCVVLNP